MARLAPEIYNAEQNRRFGRGSDEVFPSSQAFFFYKDKQLHTPASKHQVIRSRWSLKILSKSKPW
jgi:hypothetical protein